jgi:hypothetical protein
MKKLFLTSAFALFCVATAYAAQTGGVAGSIVNAVDHRSVAHAKIAITSSAYTARTESDVHGDFALLGIPPGRYLMSVTAPGRDNAISFHVCVEGNDTQRLPLLVSSANDSTYAIWVHDARVAAGTRLTQLTDRYTFGQC